MGVPGLFTHVIQHKRQLLLNKQLHDMKLVIDAHHFFHILIFSLDVSYGGDFDQIYRLTELFLKNLADCNIEPIFVYIGTHDTESRDRLLKKNQDRINQVKSYFHGDRYKKPVLPILARLVFNNALKANHIQQVTTDHVDEVTEISALANKLQCPVMSGNTSFMVANLTHGVVLVTDPKFLKFHHNVMDVPFFHIMDFIRFHRLSGPRDLSLIAAVIKYQKERSNDYCEAMPAPKGEINARIVRAVDLVRGVRAGSNREVLRQIANQIGEDDDEVEDFLQNIINIHLNLEESHLHNILQNENITGMKSFGGRQVPAWFRRAWTKGNMPRYLCAVLLNREVNLPNQMEDIDSPCSYDCSEPIRQISYGIMTSHDRDGSLENDSPGISIMEFRRSDDEAAHYDITPKYVIENFGSVITLTDVPSVPVAQRQKLILKALNVEKVALTTLEIFDEDVYLSCAILLYWVKAVEPSREHIQAMIMCLVKQRVLDVETSDAQEHDKTTNWFLRDHLTELKRRIQPLPNVNISTDQRAQLQHPFCQWQSCFIDTVQLNELLLEPFITPRPERCFNGTLAFRYLLMFKDGGKSVDDFLGSRDCRLRQFFDIVWEVLN